MLEPRHFGALSGLGMIFRQLGDKRRARAAFEQALRINPSLKNAREALKDLSEILDGQRI